MEKVFTIFERIDPAVSSFISLLKEMEQLALSAVEMTEEYARLYSLLSSVLDESLKKKIEGMKKEGRLSIPEENEKFIPLMIISVQEDVSSLISSTIKRIFEKRRGGGQPFYYLIFPEGTGGIEEGEEIVRLISATLLKGRGDGIIVLIRSFKRGPIVENAVVVNNLAIVDTHGVLDLLINSDLKVFFDDEFFGGGPISYCIHVFAKNREEVSFLDVSIPENMIEKGIERLISIMENVLESGRR